jgi:hypothetical protein
MKALVWHGKEDIRCDTVTDPEIQDPRDAIIKVTSCAICGSDLHLFHNFIPGMLPGDIMGHESMGEVVEVGSGVDGKLKKGDRIVVPSRSFAANATSASAAISRFARRRTASGISRTSCSGTPPLAPSATLISPADIPAAKPRICACPMPMPRTSRFPWHSRRAAVVSQRYLPDRLAGRRAMRHRADRYGRDLGPSTEARRRLSSGNTSTKREASN